MPLTRFQKEVISVLAAERHEASHMAGSLVPNASDDSAEDLVAASERDVLVLGNAGFDVRKLERYGE